MSERITKRKRKQYDEDMKAMQRDSLYLLGVLKSLHQRGVIDASKTVAELQSTLLKTVWLSEVL